MSSVAHAETEHLQARALFLSRCPSDQSPVTKKATEFAPIVGALISAVAGPVAKGIVGLGSKVVTKAASDTDYLLPAQTGITAPFYEVDPSGDLAVRSNIRCVVIIAAVWGSKSNPAIEDSTWVGQAIKYLNQQELVGYPVTQPQLYFEAKYMASDSLEKFALKPEAIFISSFEQSSSWGRDERKYALELSFLDIDSGTVFAKPVFTIEKLKAPYSRITCRTLAPEVDCTNESVANQSDWYPVAPLSDYLKKHVAERERNAALLAVLDTPTELVGKASLDAWDNWSTSATVGKYCDDLLTYNARVAPLGGASNSLLRNDNLCPLNLNIAQTNAQRVIAGEVSKLQYVDAYMLFEQKCGPKKDSWKNADKITIDRQRRSYFKDFPQNLDLTIFPAKPPKGSRFLPCLKELRKEIVAFGDDKETPLSSGARFQTVLKITETRYGSAFAKWLAPVVEQSKDGVASAISDALDPAKRSEKDDSKRVNSETAIIADQQVRIAQTKYDAALAGSDEDKRLDAKLNLLKAKKDANAAYAAAKLPIPYPSLE
jgi:hypothetical protein